MPPSKKTTNKYVPGGQLTAWKKKTAANKKKLPASKKTTNENVPSGQNDLASKKNSKKLCSSWSTCLKVQN